MALVITNNSIANNDGSVKVIRWAGLSEADSSPAPFEGPEWADRSVQIEGTFNGGTVVFEGSNDGTNWVTLSDPQGNAISKTAAALEQIEEVCRYMRPRVSAGTGLTINVTLLVRRQSGMRA